MATNLEMKYIQELREEVKSLKTDIYKIKNQLREFEKFEKEVSDVLDDVKFEIKSINRRV